MRTLAISIFLYACETWTLTADLERRIQALELRCFRKILSISYKDHVTNEEVRTRVKQAIGPYDDLLTTVRQRKLRWYGHISRSSGLAKTVLQGTVNGSRRRGRQKKRWEDNIREWTGLNFTTSQRAVEDRNRWREIVKMSSVVPRRPNVPDIENYAKVCEAVQVLCYLGLPTVQACVENWHQIQLQQMQPCRASAQCLPHRKPTTKSKACQPCIDWGNAVESTCYPLGKGIQWRNVNASLFHKEPVEVAKGFVFVIPHGQPCTTFGDFDVGGILKLMMAFSDYHNGDQTCYNKIEKVLDIRNSLSHKRVEDNMAISDKQLDQYFDTIEDAVTSLETHQPSLKANAIRSHLAQIRHSAVTTDMKNRALGNLSDGLKQALDEWLEKNKKGIAEAVCEELDPRLDKLKQDIVTDMKNVFAGSQ
ncbi:uncharacterized protein [Amphiura filiformis]|uniref:uncharacterized protein n=1 Tax=Amphiura filiformis TaxID=82378 RepID=UPI003B21CD0F